MKLIILDDGHGIDTLGKRTPDGYQENNFNRAVVEHLRQLLMSKDEYDVFLTATEKHDVPLLTRVQRANEAYRTFRSKYLDGACILISVHYNAYKGEWGTHGGISTFYNTQLDKSLAEIIHDNLMQGTELRDRGISQALFTILTADMASCLVECGFMDNKEEAKLMQDENYIKECAVEIMMGIHEYFNGKQIEVKYQKTKTHALIGNVKDFKAKIVKCSNRKITGKNFVNGTFFWWEDTARTKPYPTSILYHDGKTYQNVANHFKSKGKPQSCIIIYKDNTVDMKRLNNINEVDLTKIRLIIGGLGLVNKADKTFHYSPVSEGFSGSNADVLRLTQKTVIGYHEKENKIYLLSRCIAHGPLVNLCAEEDETKGFNFKFAISVDGGGSSCMNYDGNMVVNGDGRYIDNIIGFGI